MTSVATGASFVVALFAVVAILGVAFVYFRGSADKATIESQGRLIKSIQDENLDQAHRIEMLERENANLRIAVAEVKGITALRRQAESIKADTQAILAKVGGT